MRVLVLAPHPFVQERGTPLAVRALLEVLAAAGHVTEVLTYAEGQDVTIPHCTIRRLPAIPGLGNVRPGFSLKKLACDAIMLPAALGRVRKGKFDLVHAVEESAFMAALGRAWTGTPYVYDMDSSIPQQLEDRYPRLRIVKPLLEAVEGFMVRRSLAVVGMSPAIVERARQYAPGKPMRCVEDFSLLQPSPAPVDRLSQFTGGTGRIVLYVGNLEPYQGADLLLESFVRTRIAAPDAHLVLIGGRPDDIRAYERKASGLGLNGAIHFPGPRPVSHLAGYLEQADVLVSPRIRGANTPMKIYSYLDSGRAVLATRMPAHTQVLTDDIAMLAEPRPQPFGDALSGLLNDAGLRARLAAAAKARVREHFSPDAYRRKMMAFYDLVQQSLAEGGRG